MNNRSETLRENATTAASARRNRARRGMAVVVVLLLLALAMAVSYSMIRTQFTSVQMQRNSSRNCDARQAALAGLATGLRKLHEADWPGVDGVISGSLGPGQSYEVSYQVGDPSLTPTDPDYDKFSFRITVQATGFAYDPAGSSPVPSTHQARAVVELARRKLADEPSDWPTFQQFTVWQGTRSAFQVELPSRIEGRVRVQGNFEIAEDAPNRTLPRFQYLDDLKKMKNAGMADNRPFNGPVHYDVGSNLATAARLVTLGVSSVNKANGEPFAADWQQPMSLSSYQIYPGGPVYNVELVGSTLENDTLVPDPATNPLGLFYQAGNIEIRNNVWLEGTLFCGGNVSIRGTNVQLQAPVLPALDGGTTPIQLPVISCRDLNVEPLSAATVSGVVAVFHHFRVRSGSEDTSFQLNGRMIVSNDFKIRVRSEWAATNWNAEYAQWLSRTDVYPHFPQFMAAQGRDPSPAVAIRPDTSPKTYHWHKPGDPRYEPAAGDAGLKWNVVDWRNAL